MGDEASEPGGGEEEFNYDVEYKSKSTGLGALLGAIRNQEEGEIFDDEPNETPGNENEDKRRNKSSRKRQHEDEQYYEQGRFC